MAAFVGFKSRGAAEPDDFLDRPEDLANFLASAPGAGQGYGGPLAL